jgi:hypothetical protein
MQSSPAITHTHRTQARRWRPAGQRRTASLLPLRSLSPHPRAGGAVLIIVLTLLSTLVFLGFFFFSYTNQAELAARSYATAEDFKLDADEILDKAYEQVIVGTRSTYPNSALWGNRHSFLSHIVGPLSSDLKPTKDQPFTGAGIFVLSSENGDGVLNSGTGEFIRFDFDGDGYPDATLDAVNDPNNVDMDSTNNLPPLPLNFSKVARRDVPFYSTGLSTPAIFQNDIFNNAGLTSGPDSEQNVLLNYQPHVGYTYPDINSLFLSYEAAINGQRVLVPSYFRPQLELIWRNSGFGAYFTTAETASRSLRPHQHHFLQSGNITVPPTTAVPANPPNNQSYTRFISVPAGIQAQSGDTRRIIQPFPFTIDLDGNGTSNELGPLTGSGVYELDVDTDGDGIRDAIWMDLDLPLVDLPDGRQVVPLVAVRVKDADALLNINAAGNLAGFFNAGENPFLATSGSISKSNLGLSPAELNPIWALMADADLSSPTMDAPNAAGQATRDISYGLSGTTPPSVLSTANAELLFLLAGRIPSDGGSMIAGRYGETATQSFPAARAGETGADDDLDSATAASERRGGGQDGRVENFTKWNNSAPAVNIPPAVHPLDFLGTGNLDFDGTTYRSYLFHNGETPPSGTNVNAGAQRRLSSGGLANNPSVFPTYFGYWHQNQDLIPTTYGIQGYHQSPLGTQLFNNPPLNTDLTDEPNEVILHPWLYNTFDDVFRPSEMAGLHLNNSDFALTGEYSRLRDLAPFAFREAQSAPINRQRFTTDSWDRLEFARPLFGAATDNHPTGAADQNMPRRGDFTGWTQTTPPHVLLNDAYNSDTTNIHFPPQFGTNPVGSDGDPYRAELRRLLWSSLRYGTLGSGTNSLSNYEWTRVRPQHRLNLNQLLVNFDSSGNPLYRPLTPHPVFATGDMLPAGVTSMPAMDHTQLANPESTPTSLPATFAFNQINTNPFVQEWWARYDRQRMARDIYVLLWTLGNGNDLVSPANTSGQYSVGQAREMAQFAVNVVDALDRDDVITRFEYDEDLTDGWAVSPTRVVYGVESQLLTFSEVMFINAPDRANDLTTTLHRDDDLGAAGTADTDRAHQFLYIELRNTSPFSVSLDNETWRIVRVARDNPVGDNGANIQAAVQFQRDASGPKTIGPGENFLIAGHDGVVQNASNQALPADFYADISGASDLEAVVPQGATPVASSTNLPTAPLSDLDLNSTDVAHQPFVNVTHPLIAFDATYGGPNLVGTKSDDKTFDLVLQRRRNLSARGMAEQLGSGMTTSELWIEVDRIQIDANDVVDFSPNGTTQADVITALSTGNGTMIPAGGVVSLERAEPFGQNRQSRHAAGNVRNHSLTERTDANRHRKNDALTTTQFTLWEPHFNRDFSSVMELLSIPLYGYQGTSSVDPDTLTPFLTNVGTIGGAVANIATRGVADARMEGNGTAAIRFLNPGATPRPPFSDVTNSLPHYPNRWYRLLDYVTVPDGSEEAVAGQVQLQRRTPAKINLNTLRDEAVYKGVVDDTDQLTTLDSNGLPTTTDRYESGRGGVAASGNWFLNLLQSRDGIDPLILSSLGSVVPVPGTNLSRPFRELSWVTPDPDTMSSTVREQSIESTILRTDPGSTNRRGLFEARTDADAQTVAASTTAGTVDFHTRNRLLAKIHNRTTNRSHVFIVWTTIGFFEGHRIASGAAAGEVQIGAEATDIPRRRAFMVCDMSRLEEAYEDPDPADNEPGYFDFRKFIIYRKLIK